VGSAQRQASCVIYRQATPSDVCMVSYDAVTVSSGNAWERHSQSYSDSGNGVPRNDIKHLIRH